MVTRPNPRYEPFRPPRPAIDCVLTLKLRPAAAYLNVVVPVGTVLPVAYRTLSVTRDRNSDIGAAGESRLCACGNSPPINANGTSASLRSIEI